MASQTSTSLHKPMGTLTIGDGNHPQTFEEFMDLLRQLGIETTPDSKHLLQQCFEDEEGFRDQFGEEKLAITTPRKLVGHGSGRGLMEGSSVERTVNAASRSSLICCQFLSGPIMCTRQKDWPQKPLTFVSRAIRSSADGQPYYFSMNKEGRTKTLEAADAHPHRVWEMDHGLVFARLPDI